MTEINVVILYVSIKVETKTDISSLFMIFHSLQQFSHIQPTQEDIYDLYV